MDGNEQQQHDGVAPLLEPAVLVVTNCGGKCRGTGFVVTKPGGGTEAPWELRDPLATDMPNHTEPCPTCDGSGRVVSEMLLSEFVELIGSKSLRLSAPSPSEVRRGA